MYKTAVLALLLTVPSMALARSFKDVPKKHWAYGAIHSLVKSGLIQGKKGNFDGKKAFSRYEMAVVLARYMEKLGSAKRSLQGTIKKTYPLLKKLASEFSSELDLLGVKHQEVVARVTSLETRTDLHQRELQELRALVEENRRLLMGRNYAGGREAVRTAPQARAPAQAPVQYGLQMPPVYRTIAPPPVLRAPAPRPPAARPQAMDAAQYAPPISRRTPEQLFASAPPLVPSSSDAQRLQSLRLRARGLLNGTTNRSSRRQHRPSSVVAAAPAPVMQMAARPVQRRRLERGEILDAIDRVRSGELPPDAVNLYEAPTQATTRTSNRWRRAPSKVYPLSERLFGTMSLGPPSGE